MPSKKKYSNESSEESSDESADERPKSPGQKLLDKKKIIGSKNLSSASFLNYLQSVNNELMQAPNINKMSLPEVLKLQMEISGKHFDTNVLPYIEAIDILEKKIKKAQFSPINEDNGIDDFFRYANAKCIEQVVDEDINSGQV